MTSSYFIRCIYSHLKKFTKNSALPNFFAKIYQNFRTFAKIEFNVKTRCYLEKSKHLQNNKSSSKKSSFKYQIHRNYTNKILVSINYCKYECVDLGVISLKCKISAISLAGT